MGQYDYQDVPDSISMKVWISIGIGLAVVGIILVYVFTLPPSHDQMVDDLYDEGFRWVQNGNLTIAIGVYDELISIAPNEERAYHEKGKILNRLEACDEALEHYEKYVSEFPTSSRGLEGYEIAKNCKP